MKVITIGRGTDCQVVLDEPTISRRHAILKVHPFGKMELVDMSQNGTFVNGVKLSSNVPYPVSRKDVVSFAHQRTLDWSMIPNPMNYVKYGFLALLGIALVIGAVVWVKSLGGDEAPVQEEVVTTQPTGKTDVKTPAETPEQKEEVDTEKGKKDKIVYPKLPDAPKKNKKEKVKEEKPKEEPKPEEQPKTTKPVYL